jgi:hypothetical protein
MRVEASEKQKLPRRLGHMNGRSKIEPDLSSTSRL